MAAFKQAMRIGMRAGRWSHPAAPGAVRGQRVVPLGVDRFGQGGDIPDLYRECQLDVDAILDACAQVLLG